MPIKSLCVLGLALALVGLLHLSVPRVSAADPETGDLKPEQFKPRWKVGQKWVVETLTTQLQVRRDFKQTPKARPVQWQFEVQGIEKVDGKDCYKVQITCQVDDRNQPVTIIWSNTKTMMLQQLQTQFPVQGGFRTVTEQYKSAAGRPAPVLAPLTVLPLEMPVFLDNAGEKALGPQEFSYQTVEGPGGTKEVDDVGFTFDVQQELAPATAKDAAGKVADNFSKGLENAPLVKVELKGPGKRGRQVSQLWQADQPWPVYTNNGSTVARLVKVIPAP
jgi:hypothetical protein